MVDFTAILQKKQQTAQSTSSQPPSGISSDNMPPEAPPLHDQQASESQTSSSLVDQNMAGGGSPLVVEINTDLPKTKPSGTVHVPRQVQPLQDSADVMMSQMQVEELQIFDTFSGKVLFAWELLRVRFNVIFNCFRSYHVCYEFGKRSGNLSSKRRSIK